MDLTPLPHWPVGSTMISVRMPAPLCAWWNLACKGGTSVANAGLSAITKSIAAGAETLLQQIVTTIDESSTVPLSDPTYRHVYFGFIGLAAPLVGIVLLLAVIVAAIRRDAATLARAVTGVAVAGLGGALYIVFAQLLVAVDDYLADGVVRVTGYNLTTSIQEIADGFHHIAGAPGDIAANMLLILLMLIMLVAGLILWFVLVLRKMAILVVVAFAPLLIVGYLWAPTRGWVRRATEVLVALVFTKTAIFTLFGIGLALLSRGPDQSLSDFVGTVVLLCGACFAPMVMLRLVHFAADTHLAGDAIGTLRGGLRPLTDRLSHATGPGAAMGRSDFARSQGQGPQHDPGTLKADPPTSGAGTWGSASGGAAGSSAGGGASTGAAASSAAGPAAAAVAAAEVAKAATDQAKEAGKGAVASLATLAPSPGASSPTSEMPLHGPEISHDSNPQHNTGRGGHQ